MYIDEIPDSIQIRLMSVRAFDADGMLLDADVVEGAELDPVLAAMFDNEAVAFIPLHKAWRGYYAALVERATI